MSDEEDDIVLSELPMKISCCRCMMIFTMV